MLINDTILCVGAVERSGLCLLLLQLLAARYISPRLWEHCLCIRSSCEESNVVDDTLGGTSTL